MTIRGRALLLAATLVLGAAAGFLGRLATGSDAWFLAVPAFMVVGWAFVADPTACAPGADSRASNPAADDAA